MSKEYMAVREGNDVVYLDTIVFEEVSRKPANTCNIEYCISREGDNKRLYLDSSKDVSELQKIAKTYSFVTPDKNVVLEEYIDGEMSHGWLYKSGNA